MWSNFSSSCDLHRTHAKWICRCQISKLMDFFLLLSNRSCLYPSWLPVESSALCTNAILLGAYFPLSPTSKSIVFLADSCQVTSCPHPITLQKWSYPFALDIFKFVLGWVVVLGFTEVFFEFVLFSVYLGLGFYSLQHCLDWCFSLGCSSQTL